MDFHGLLIASDLDGTLVAPGGFLPQRNVEALRRFCQGGGLFTIATGRTVESAGRFLGQLPVNAPAICLNGGLLYSYQEERVLACETLPKEEAAFWLKRLYDAFPTLGMECFYQRAVGIVRRSPHIGNTTTREIFPFAGGVETGCFEPWLKLLFGGEESLVQAAFAYVRNQPHPGLRFVFSSPNFLEVLPENTNKGAMLARLAQQLHIPRENIYAVGDYDNDRELLAAAGHAVTPANAPAELRATAELTVCSCEQGALAGLVEYLEAK
ncbi:MAG TPA: HAD-IIB family hydrolase [Candidatus Caccousia avistercoris]|nr:HAD-IIB family hydrolase [Candidatus Caccousia avistercoris]